MAIPASELVRIMPRVLAGTGQDLVFNGLFLTDNAAAPADGELLQFLDAQSVGAFFGRTSNEFKAAQVYFTGYNNSLTKPSTLFITNAMRTEKRLQLRGADIDNQKAVLTAINGDPANLAITIKLTASGSAHTFTPALTSAPYASLSALLSDLNTVLATDSAYPSTLEFSLVVGDGMDAHVMLTTTGTQLNAGIEITEITGAMADLLGISDSTRVLYQPYKAAQADISAVLDAVAANSMNWVTFTTINTTPLTYSENEKLVAWIQSQFAEGNQFLYVHWTDEAALQTTNASGTVTAQIRELNAEGVTHVWDSFVYAAFVMGCAASIAWDRNNSTITFAYKAQAGLPALIKDKTKARNLITNGVNFVGDYASRNDDFVLFQNGQMDGQFKWIDTYLNSTWLNNALQVQILAGFEQAPRVPYTDVGYTLIRSWVQDVVNRAISNGVIDTGLNLSETQKSALMQETGGVDITTELHNSGYYLQIVDATAQIRQQRESPACNFWYTYGGSVHKLNLPSTAVV